MSLEDLVKAKFDEARRRLEAKNEELATELKKRVEAIKNEAYKKFQESGV